MDQEFQTVRTTEEEEVGNRSNKKSELNESVGEQDFCFPKNFDNLNDTSKGFPLEEIKEESTCRCSSSMNSSMNVTNSRESSMRMSASKENKVDINQNKRTSFLKSNVARGNLKEILNTENLIVEFKSAEKKSILQKYEEKTKNVKLTSSKRLSCSQRSQDLNLEISDSAGCFGKDIRDSLSDFNTNFFEGSTLYQSKYISATGITAGKISSYTEANSSRQMGKITVPLDAMRRKKQIDENLGY